MSGSNFPNGPVGPGFSLNFFRPELRASGSSSSMPAHSQPRPMPSSRNPFLSCQPAAHSANQTVSASNANQKHSTSAAATNAAATIPNLTVIAPNGGLVTAAAAAAAAAHLPQFSHNSVLNSLFQSLLRGQNPIASVNLAMQSNNVAASYMNSVSSAALSSSSTTACSSSVVGERYSLTSKPSPTQPSESSVRLGNSFPPHPNLSNSVSLQGQKLVTTIATSMKSTQPAMNHDTTRVLPNNTITSSSHAVSTTTSSTSSGVTSTTMTIHGGGSNSMHPLEMLFHPTNITTIQPGAGSNKSALPPVQKLSAMSFLRWASNCTRSFRRSRMSPWPRSHADIDALHGMNWIVAPTGLLGIYSESPFLRPVLLLRRVQFATPGNLVSNFPDPDNMIRTLRDLADAKVTKYAPFAPDYPSCASAVGFTTDYLSCVFTLDLDRLIVKLLSEQLRPSNRRPQGPEWRVVLRLGWATSDFYLPPMQPEKRRQYRALVLEALPRCLTVRVGGRPISLPDPIFHGGQAQRLGKRLRLSIDITDRLPIRPSGTIRNRIVDVEVNWLHAPLEDQSQGLLDLVAGGQITPLLCHLIGLPLIQVTLDRLYSIRELQTAFRPDPNEGCVFDHWAEESMGNKDLFPLLVNADGSPSDGQKGVWGAYDNCTPAAQVLTTESIKNALKVKFEASMDEDLCITDGTNDGLNYIPICLLCPLTRTRIELPVRSIQCAHLQCFDFNAYLTINRRRPRWTCPICSVPAPFRDLRLDELFATILDDPNTADATFVHVDPTGQWRLAPEEGGDNHSSTTTTGHSHANSRATQSTHGTPGKSEDVSTLSPPRLVAACGSGANSPAQSGTAPANGDAPPDLPSILSPVKSAPTDPTPMPVTTAESAEIEVIVLSDDEDDVGSEALNGPTSGPVNPTMYKDRPAGPQRNGRATSEVSRQSRGSDTTVSANPDEVQIDLTVDDDDDDDNGSLSSSDRMRQVRQTSRIYVRATESNSNQANAKSQSELDDERLRNARPLILISPLLPPVLTGVPDAPGSSATSASADSGLGPTEAPKPSELSVDDGLVEPERIAADATKPAPYRHLFDAFGGLSAHPSTPARSTDHSSSGGPRAVNRADSDGTVARSKRRHTSDRRTHAGSVTRSVRPVSTYMDSADMDNCVPGVDLFDYSDDEPAFSLDGSRHLPASSSSHLSSSSTAITSTSGRPRPPLLKAAQANALTRLVQQRAGRPHSAASDSVTATVASSSGSAGVSHTRARKSTSRGGLPASRGRSAPQRGAAIGRSTSRKRARRGSGRRRRTSNARVSDDSDSSPGSCFSSEMSCVSASDESTHEGTSSEASSDEAEDDDSVDSLSSDDRWSPSRNGRVKLVVDVRRGRVRRAHTNRR